MEGAKLKVIPGEYRPIPVLNLDEDTKELLYCLDRGLPAPPSLIERMRAKLGLREEPPAPRPSLIQ
jgi:hypothetical protein